MSKAEKKPVRVPWETRDGSARAGKAYRQDGGEVVSHQDKILLWVTKLNFFLLPVLSYLKTLKATAIESPPWLIVLWYFLDLK